MKTHKINDMIGGWFIGDFKPTLHNSSNFEVAYKEYKKDDYEPFHHHKIAKEFTLIAEGEVLMNGIKYFKGDIIEISPNESTDFKALSFVKTVVVKIPSAKNDKYLD